jgi:hypothetical protein
MATTAISVKTVNYPALSADSRQMKIIAANLDGEAMSELDLVRVKTPLGGGTTWNIDNNGNVETCDEIVGLLVGVGKRGVLWPEEDPSDKRPVIVTNDLRDGWLVSNDLGSISPEVLEKYRTGAGRYDWQRLSNGPEFGYGSSRSGSGKRCKESRILAILRDGETWPILVTVGPGSLRNIIPSLKRLPCLQHEAVIGLKLVKAKGKGGQPYSQISMRLVGQLTEEQGEVARTVYVDPIKAMFSAPPAVAALDGAGGDDSDGF